MKTYAVTSLLPPGNRQNRDEISDVLEARFNPGSQVPGGVSPVQRWDLAVDPLAPAGDLGDGATNVFARRLFTASGKLAPNFVMPAAAATVPWCASSPCASPGRTTRPTRPASSCSAAPAPA